MSAGKDLQVNVVFFLYSPPLHTHNLQYIFLVSFSASVNHKFSYPEIHSWAATNIYELIDLRYLSIFFTPITSQKTRFSYYHKTQLYQRRKNFSEYCVVFSLFMIRNHSIDNYAKNKCLGEFLTHVSKASVIISPITAIHSCGIKPIYMI